MSTLRILLTTILMQALFLKTEVSIMKERNLANLDIRKSIEKAA